MAARSGASEGINLISSTYFYDDDETEDIDHQEPQNEVVNYDDKEDDSKNKYDEEKSFDSANDDDTLPLSNDLSRSLTPLQQPQLSLSSPPPHQPVMSESSRSRLGRLTIVDYGHDEVALSPEAEEGEILGTGVVVISTQLQTTNGDMQEKTPPGTAHVQTPGNQMTII